MSKSKGEAKIYDMTNFELVSAPLTLAALKRIVKQYKKLDMEVRAVFNNEEVTV